MHAQITQELTSPEQVYLSNLHYHSANESTILARVSTNFIKNQISSRYLEKMEAKLLELIGKKINIEIEVSEEVPKNSANIEQNTKTKTKREKQLPALLPANPNIQISKKIILLMNT